MPQSLERDPGAPKPPPTNADVGRRLPQKPAAKAVASTPRLAPVPAPMARTAPRRGFAITAEHGLAAAGIAIAVVSGCFGIYMNVRPEPEFAGSKYWTVFAQLAHGGRAAGADAPAGNAGIDPVVTGSIPAGSAAGAERNSPAPTASPGAAAAGSPRPVGTLKGYVVRDVFDGMALVESPYGLTLIKPGAVLLGAGQVTGIEMRAGKWVVLTSQGVIGTAPN